MRAPSTERGGLLSWATVAMLRDASMGDNEDRSLVDFVRNGSDHVLFTSATLYSSFACLPPLSLAERAQLELTDALNQEQDLGSCPPPPPFLSSTCIHPSRQPTVRPLVHQHQLHFFAR